MQGLNKSIFHFIFDSNYEMKYTYNNVFLQGGIAKVIQLYFEFGINGIIGKCIYVENTQREQRDVNV